MKLEVLISTYNRKEYSFLDKMNIQTDIVVGNQIGKDEKFTFKKNYGNVKIVCSNTKGLSYNRNITLANSEADICLLGDDDLVYLDNYFSTILKQFENNPSADVIIFNIHEASKKRYVTKDTFVVNNFNYMRFGSVRIAFRRDRILAANIKFDERFGAGSEIPMGEDTIFLKDCLSKGLKIVAVPEYILHLTEERESTWFNGYVDEYFINKGKLFKRLYPKIWILIALQDIVRHRRLYGKNKSMYQMFKTMLKGGLSFHNN